MTSYYKFFLAINFNFEEFDYLGVFKVCLEETSDMLLCVTEVTIAPYDGYNLCNKSSCQVLGSTL